MRPRRRIKEKNHIVKKNRPTPAAASPLLSHLRKQGAEAIASVRVKAPSWVPPHEVEDSSRQRKLRSVSACQWDEGSEKPGVPGVLGVHWWPVFAVPGRTGRGQDPVLPQPVAPRPCPREAV